VIRGSARISGGYAGTIFIDLCLIRRGFKKAGICLANFYNHKITQISTRKRILLTWFR